MSKTSSAIVLDGVIVVVAEWFWQIELVLQFTGAEKLKGGGQGF